MVSSLHREAYATTLRLGLDLWKQLLGTHVKTPEGMLSSLSLTDLCHLQNLSASTSHQMKRACSTRWGIDCQDEILIMSSDPGGL